MRVKNKKDILNSLPHKTDDIVNYCLNVLNIPRENHELFLTILLSTLSGFASLVKYKSQWEQCDSMLQNEFLALRIVLFVLISNDWQFVISLAKSFKKTIIYKQLNLTKMSIKTICCTN